MAPMPPGDGELWEEGRIGMPGPAGAPGIIEAATVSEDPAMPTAPADVVEVFEVLEVFEVPEVVEVPEVPSVAGLRTTPDVPHIPLWGPPSRGSAGPSWEQADPDGSGIWSEASRTASVPIEPVALGPPVRGRRYRRTVLVGVPLAGAVLLLGVVGMAAWPSTETTESVADQLGQDTAGPTDRDGAPAELPPSQPATPVSFGVTGDVVQPEPRRARIVDPRSGQDVVVDLPAGTTVDPATGQVVVRITGTPTSIRPSTTTTTQGTTTSTTEDTTTTTEDTTTSTVEDPTTTETYPPSP